VWVLLPAHPVLVAPEMAIRLAVWNRAEARHAAAQGAEMIFPFPSLA